MEYGSIGQSSTLDALDDGMVPQVEEHNACNMHDPAILENYPEPKALQSLSVSMNRINMF